MISDEEIKRRSKTRMLCFRLAAQLKGIAVLENTNTVTNICIKKLKVIEDEMYNHEKKERQLQKYIPLTLSMYNNWVETYNFYGSIIFPIKGVKTKKRKHKYRII